MSAIVATRSFTMSVDMNFVAAPLWGRDSAEVSMAVGQNRRQCDANGGHSCEVRMAFGRKTHDLQTSSVHCDRDERFIVLQAVFQSRHLLGR